MFPPCRYALHEGARRPVPARVLRAQYGGDFELLARGARLHAAAPDGLPPLATAHLPTVAAVFATPLTRALVERIGADHVTRSSRRRTRSRSRSRCCGAGR